MLSTWNTIVKAPLLAGRPRTTVVQEAGTRDMRAVADMHAACFARGWSTHEIERLAAHPGTDILVARAEGGGQDAPLGFLILRRDGTGPEAEAEIVSVGVPPRARRKGVGERLMRHAIRLCQTDRLGRLLLEVDESNRGAVALYRRLGFTQVGTREGYYVDGATPPARALVMALGLS